MLFAIYLAMTGLFVLLGVVFAAGKGTGLIAGYNTASAEEKANYDKKKGPVKIYAQNCLQAPAE
jgi:hypothetical protein